MNQMRVSLICGLLGLSQGASADPEFYGGLSDEMLQGLPPGTLLIIASTPVQGHEHLHVKRWAEGRLADKAGAN